MIYKHFNYCINKGEFPNDLKHDDIVPIYKKDKKREKENYRPVSILSSLSKIYEKLLYNLLYDYFNNILFPRQCGLPKGYSAQDCILVMIEKYKEVLPTNLPNILDCINHPIAKLYNSELSLTLFFPICAIRPIKPKSMDVSVRDLEKNMVCHRDQF